MPTTPTPNLNTYAAILAAFSDFLTVSIHTILFERALYPRESFLRARKFNYPVRQSRHPEVCKWIQDAVKAVEVEMAKVGFFVPPLTPLSLCVTFLLTPRTIFRL